MDLSIIIVSWNTKHLLQQCLRSLEEHVEAFKPSAAGPRSNACPDRSRRVETFVVDNASTDGSADMVRERFPGVHLIESEENLGFARANNRAIRRSGGRYVLLLNSDTLVREGAITRMLSFMDRHRQVGVLGPALLNDCGDVSPSWAQFPTLVSELFERHPRTRKPFLDHMRSSQDSNAYEVDWMAGACLLVRRQAIDQVGLMDERFFLYSEETDWCRRIKSAGWLNVYYPEARVVHVEGASSVRDRPRTLLLLNRSKILYAEKHFGSQRASALRVGLGLRALAKAALRLLQARPADARAQWTVARHLWSDLL